MDGKGRASDNIFTVHRSGTVKYEHVYLMAYTDGWPLETGLPAYFAFYDEPVRRCGRFHRSLHYQTPEQVLKGTEKSTLNQVENKIN